MDVNEHEGLSNITLKTQIKVKEQLVERNAMDINEHGRLFNITLRHMFYSQLEVCQPITNYSISIYFILIIMKMVIQIALLITLNLFPY